MTNHQHLGISELPEANLPYKAGLTARILALLKTFNWMSTVGLTYVLDAILAPSRKVRSTTRSMAGVMCSRKMGATISVESRSLELACAWDLEHDDDVLAFFDQPPVIKLVSELYGRRFGYQQTPDFLAVRYGGVNLVECKPVAEIHKKLDKDPNFYVQVNGRWTCPPAQRAAEEMGMRHEVFTEQQVCVMRWSNLRLLGDYFSETDKIPQLEDARTLLTSVLEKEGRVRFSELLQRYKGRVCIDHMYALVARGDVVADLDREPLAEPDYCWIYRDQITLEACSSARPGSADEQRLLCAPSVSTKPNSELQWDGASWTVANCGAEELALRSDATKSLQLLAWEEFNGLVQAGRISQFGGTTDQAARAKSAALLRLANASPKYLKVALARLDKIRKYLTEAPGPKCRSLRRYVSDYRAAERRCGVGLVGLLPQSSNCGNRTPRLRPEVREIAEAVTNEFYRTPIGQNAKLTYNRIREACEKKALPPPSYQWYCNYLRGLDQYQLTKDRQGARAAYKLRPRVDVDSIQDLPEWLFGLGYLDHTEIDLEIVDELSGEPLGKVWLTLLLDFGTRSVLAFHLSFEPPSYRSVLRVLRECVRRWGRLPSTLVVDGGKEFRGTYARTLAGAFEIDILDRPAAQSRYGSQGERMFGTLNTNVIHNLMGNTKLRKNVRQMTAEVDPDGFAIWTIRALHALLTQYLFDVYDVIEHTGIQMTPRHARLRSANRYGYREHRAIAFDRSFNIFICPGTVKGTGKVQSDGVKINYVYYNAPELHKHAGKRVQVKFDPFDASKAYALIDGHWIDLRTRLTASLRHRSQREMETFVDEWRKRNRDVSTRRLSDKKLVQFMKEVEGTEVLLLERRRAAEDRRLRLEIDGQSEEVGTVPVGGEPQTAGTASRSDGVESPDPFAIQAGDLEIVEVY